MCALRAQARAARRCATGLIASTARSGDPCSSPWRDFTSTNTVRSPSVATMSTSANLGPVQLRASMR